MRYWSSRVLWLRLRRIAAKALCRRFIPVGLIHRKPREGGSRCTGAGLKTLETSEEKGRTVAKVNLVTEPTTILALYKAPPKAVQVKAADAALGAELVFACGVLAADGQSLGPVPVGYAILDPAGAERETLYRAAGDEVRFPLPVRDMPGEWTVRAQEMLTGIAASVKIAAAGAVPGPAVAAIGDVHVVNEAHLRAFAGSDREKWVVLEPNQKHLLPLAEELTAALTNAGAKARLWEVRPEQYDTIPMRWYPWDEDKERMKQVEEGKLIGYRGNMQPYIDKKKRAHVPERGGWADIDPPYMVGSDCIVFSGGRLAESLRSVTLWMDTPNVPGKGQGRLVTVFSPFLADKDAVAVVGNDIEGLTKAADRLVALFEGEPAKPQPVPPAPKLKPIASESAPAPLHHAYCNYTPVRRVERLLANERGRAAVCLRGKKDTIAFVDENGSITATVAPDEPTTYDILDNDGTLWHYRRRATGFHPGWHFATSHVVTVQRIKPGGSSDQTMQVYDGDTGDIAAEWWFETSFPLAPDGQAAFLGRKGGFFLGKLGDAQWNRHDDLPRVRHSFETRTPRFPVGVTFSPDSRFVLYTMDTRPAGFGGMNSRAWQPCGNETVLMEVATGKRVWSLRGSEPRGSRFAVHPGFAALARDGRAAAFADYNGVVYLVNKSGTILVQSETIEQSRERRRGPTKGVGVRMSDDGSLAAFAFKNFLLIGRDAKIRRVDLPMVVSCCVSRDGSKVVAGLEDGRVQAFARDGELLWTFAAGGVGPIIAAGTGGQTLVGTSAGELVSLDGDGKELRRLNVAAAADKETHPVEAAAGMRELPRPSEYRGPGTLALAREHLEAKRIAAWEPAGQGAQAFGKTFYKLDAHVRLNAPDQRGECFVHLVYRKPDGNPAITVVTEGADGKETFVLDLPAPEYREVDIPVRGPGVRASVSADAPVEVAACSLWSFAWFGPNLAYVKPAGAVDTIGGALLGDAEETLDDSLDLDEFGGTSGRLKDAKVWWPNTDVDQVAGPWLPSSLSPLDVVDARRFGGGRLAPWAGTGAKGGNFAGAWFSLDFGKAIDFSLVATYDRVTRQSEVTTNLAILDGFGGEHSRVLTGAVGSDQFWRLFFLPEETRLQELAVLAYTGALAGLSEIEVYSTRGLME